LAIMSPILIGFAFGELALGGFLAGSILSAQLMAVFMANAGGAWDNAKKTIEDGLYGGKGSDAHKASVIGDTVGDPLKDTAGPALNPMVKVLNLVAVIVAPMVVGKSVLYLAGDGKFSEMAVPLIVCIVAAAALVWAIFQSKRETDWVGDAESRGSRKKQKEKSED
ncbi:MAG: sodium/proton-translocating pyrophosphatase, partial [Thermoplasmata archaeon]